MNKKEIKNRLREFICKELILNPDYPLEDDEALITGGLIDSYSLVQIAVFVEDNFHVNIPDTEFTVENMDTLSSMAVRIRQEME